MRIQFLGACRTVTGTCHLIQIGDRRIALDCGMFQGARDESRDFNEWIPEPMKHADAIVLSHGHLDHCGKLPVIVRGGYKGPIYCTQATADVARVVLEDSAKIQVEDAEYLNRRQRRPGDPMLQPLYNPADVELTRRCFRTVRYGQPIDLGGGVTATLLDAGHILGSAYVVLEWKEDGKDKRLLFTADIGRFNTPIIRDPYTLPGVFDTVITESTYGGKSHGPVDQIEPQLLAAVKQTIAKRGRLIVPSFAVGRTQTVLWYIHKFINDGVIPPINVYVDSPMGVEMTHIYSNHRDDYDSETAERIGGKDLFGLAKVNLATSAEESKRINSDRGPCVIIASSPTCEFGRVLHHIRQSIENPNDMILFVGFIPDNTLGRRLQDGNKHVRIYNVYYDVRCEVRTIHGLSAHADGDELLRFLAPTLKPQSEAFVVHGESDQAETFGNRLIAAGMGRATVPALETSMYD